MQLVWWAGGWTAHWRRATPSHIDDEAVTHLQPVVTIDRCGGVPSSQRRWIGGIIEKPQSADQSKPLRIDAPTAKHSFSSPCAARRLTGPFSQRRPSIVRVRNQSASTRRGSRQGPSPAGHLISVASSSRLSPFGCEGFSCLFICTVFLFSRLSSSLTFDSRGAGTSGQLWSIRMDCMN